MSIALSDTAAPFPESVLEAAAHPDPYPYYAALLAYRPIYRERRLGLWIAVGATAVTEILNSAHCRVRPSAEPVPAAIAGAPAGDIFRHLVRMSEGPRRWPAPSPARSGPPSIGSASLCRSRSLPRRSLFRPRSRPPQRR
jgi:hypothetical protein